MVTAGSTPYYRGDQGRQDLVTLALGLVDRDDPVPLTLESLAKAAGKKSRGAPLHVFGGVGGLYAAVGAEGFRRLARELAEVPEQPTGLGELIALTMAHARFGLEHPNLYRIMHHPEAWKTESAPEPEEEGPRRRFLKQREMLAQLDEQRYASLLLFSQAEERGLGDASLRIRPSERSLAWHLLTTLTDGFLFQVREERVLAELPVEKQLEAYQQRVALVIRGLRGDRGDTREV
jgi:hypothetical protein